MRSFDTDIMFAQWQCLIRSLGMARPGVAPPLMYNSADINNTGTLVTVNTSSLLRIYELIFDHSTWCLFHELLHDVIKRRRHLVACSLNLFPVLSFFLDGDIHHRGRSVVRWLPPAWWPISRSKLSSWPPISEISCVRVISGLSVVLWTFRPIFIEK